MRVSRDAQTEVPGLAHRRLQFVRCELLRIRIASMRQNCSRRKHLDMVRAVMRQQANFLTDLPGTVRFAVIKIPRQLYVRSISSHRAGASDDRDISARYKHSRPNNVT